MAVLKRPNKRKIFNIIKSVREIETMVNVLPDHETCYKFVSSGGFSSISFVKFVADRTHINYLFASTLRVGAKHLKIIDNLKRAGKLDICEFVVGSIMRDGSRTDKKYGYYDDLEKVCRVNGWTVRVLNNHSKILLFDTFDGKFVLETSSNLNENPKCEQFSLERDEGLYDFYLNFFRMQFII